MTADPARYLHGDRRHRLVLVPQPAARWLYFKAGLRDRGEIDDPEVEAAIVALALAALEAPGSDPGSDQARMSEPAQQLTLSTSTAADRLRVSARAIVKAINQRRLPATMVGGRWRIDPHDLDQYHRR